MSRGISSRSNLAETCHAMLVSTDAMSKSRHQQLLQSLPVNFCGPMVYSNKLVDIGGSWFQPHCDFDWFSTSTCDMASVSRGNLSSKQRLPRPMSTQGRGWIPGAPHYPLVVLRMSISVGILLEFLLVILIDSPISHFPRDFHGFPKISRRSPEVGHAVFPDANQTKGTARWIQRRLCAQSVSLQFFMSYNVF